MRFKFDAEGTAAGDQTWQTSGEFDLPLVANADPVAQAMRMSFEQLTGGKAVYGKPGIGCAGPYRIQRFLLEAIAPEGLPQDVAPGAEP